MAWMADWSLRLIELNMVEFPGYRTTNLQQGTRWTERAVHRIRYDNIRLRWLYTVSSVKLSIDSIALSSTESRVLYTIAYN